MSQSSSISARSAARFLPPRPAVCALLFVTTLGLALRLFGLDSGLWYDEIYSLVVTSRPPLREILTHYYGEIQHPLYSVLVHGTVVALGESAWTARLPAVIFGVASIPLLFLLGRALASEREGLLAAALMTLSYHHVWFSQNARGYTALLCSTLLCTWLFYRGMERSRWPLFLAYSVAAALGAYTHPTFAFVIIGHFLLILVVAAQSLRRGGNGWRSLALPAGAIVLAGLLTLALYAPLIGPFVDHYHKSSGQMKTLSTPGWAVVEALRGLELGLGSQLALLAAATLVGCGLYSFWRDNRLAFLLLVLPSIVTVVGVVGISGSMYPRYLFFTLGFAILIVVRGAMVLGNAVSRLGDPSKQAGRGRVIGSACILLVIIASAATLGRAYRHPKQDFAGALAFVESQRRATEPVVTAGAAAWPYQNYYRRDWPKIKDIKQVESIRGQARRVWLVYTFPRYIEGETPGLMDAIGLEFKTIRVFPGTLLDGEVFVCVKDVAEAASL
jgi:mannosyltransferase